MDSVSHGTGYCLNTATDGDTTGKGKAGTPDSTTSRTPMCDTKGNSEATQEPTRIDLVEEW